MQRDVKRSVETANLEYYATLQLGVVQMDVWIIGYLRIVQVLTVNPIDEYVMQYIDTENMSFMFHFAAQTSSSILNLGCPLSWILCYLFIQLILI